MLWSRPYSLILLDIPCTCCIPRRTSTHLDVIQGNAITYCPALSQAVDMTPRERVIYLAKAANPSYKVAHPRQVRMAEAAAAGNGIGSSLSGQPSNRNSNRSGTGPQRSISSKSMASMRGRDREPPRGSCTQVPGQAPSSTPKRGGPSGLPPIAAPSGTSSQPPSPTGAGVTPSREASVASAATAGSKGGQGPSAGAGSPKGRSTGSVDTHSPRPRGSGTHATATAGGPATGSPGEGGEGFPLLSPVRAAPGRGERNSSGDSGGAGGQESFGQVPAALPPLTAVSAASMSGSGTGSGRGDKAVGSECRHGQGRDEPAAGKVRSCMGGTYLCDFAGCIVSTYTTTCSADSRHAPAP